MKLDLAPKQTDELIPTPLVHQTAFWGRVSRRLGHRAEAYDLAVEPGPAAAAERGDFLVIRSPLSDDVECAYVPFGPELSPDAEQVGLFLERLSRELAPLLGPRCAFIRWDLPWTSLHAREPADFTEDGTWSGPPSPRAREIRMNIGTEEKNLWKAPRDLLPPDSVLVDLTAPEEELLARMHHKTRYNVRLAERQGVEVSEGTLADLPAWYELYLETMARHQLAPQPLSHIRAVLEERGHGSASPVQTRLLLARYRGRILAGMLLALAPARATYLYGASTRELRHLMAPSALQWAAIRTARAHGCLDYDMLGAAPRSGEPHPLAGVHRFKLGFGGRLVHREGCWDYPLDGARYTAVRRWEQAHLATRAILA
ncbi:MAG TPA: peptidoglycan bridge formation glycyltransferase FemA/FemB family protein [Kofleriaceae bacterium]|nr:peptidoglycan bridge formation glycyltransferase FemA/FemB family protein [Kofleriaceae bacterium]